MCRLMAYLGTECLLADLVTKPARSLTRQSYDAKERQTGHGYLNGDGFGIGWYSPEGQHQQEEDPTPCVFSSIQPAWNNRNLERLANKITSPLIFAHVRAAYPGIPVNEANCQPFVCGRYLWMHNGGVGGFPAVRRRLLNSLRDDVYEMCPSFESDSAICFALFLNLIQDSMQQLPPEDLVAAMQSTIDTIVTICAESQEQQQQRGGNNRSCPPAALETSLLNFVVSDGRTVVATRFTDAPGQPGASLYYTCGSRFEQATEEEVKREECVAAGPEAAAVAGGGGAAVGAGPGTAPGTHEPANQASGNGQTSAPEVSKEANSFGGTSNDAAFNNRYLVRHSDRRALLGIVASEPLTEEKSDWIQVPRNTMVVFTRYKGPFVDLLLVPIHPPATVARDLARSFKALASCPPPPPPSLASPFFPSSVSSPFFGSLSGAGSAAEGLWNGRAGQDSRRGRGRKNRAALHSNGQLLDAAARLGNGHTVAGNGAVNGLSNGINGMGGGQGGPEAESSDEEDEEGRVRWGQSEQGNGSSSSSAFWNGKLGRNVPGSVGLTASPRHSFSSSTLPHTAPPSSALSSASPTSAATQILPPSFSSPVLAVAVHGSRVFSGYQDGSIRAFDLSAFSLLRCIPRAHDQSIFALTVHSGRLYSSSSQLVKIWDLHTFALLYTLGYSDGDVFALALAQGRAVGGPAGTFIVRCNRLKRGAAAGGGAVAPACGQANIARALIGKSSYQSAGSKNFSYLDGFSEGEEEAGKAEGQQPGTTGGAAERIDLASTSSSSLLSSSVSGQTSRMRRMSINGSSSTTNLLGSSGLSNGCAMASRAGGEVLPSHLEVTQPSSNALRILEGRGGGGAEGRLTDGPVIVGSLPTWREGGSLVSRSGGNGLFAEAERDAAVEAGTENMKRVVGFAPAPTTSKRVDCTDSCLPCARPPAAAAAAAPAAAPPPPQPATAPAVPCRTTEATVLLTDAERMGHCSRVLALVVCDPGGLMCSGGGDALVKVWSLSTGDCCSTLHGHKGGVMALAAVRDAKWDTWRLLSGSRDNTIRVWDLSSLSPITVLTGHTDDVMGLAVGKQEEFFSASVDFTVRMWSLATYECLWVLTDASSSISTAPSPHQNHHDQHNSSNFTSSAIHSSGGGRGGRRGEPSGPAVLLSLACTEEGGVVAGASDGKVRYWDAPAHPKQAAAGARKGPGAAAAAAVPMVPEDASTAAPRSTGSEESGEGGVPKMEGSPLGSHVPTSFRIQPLTERAQQQQMEEALRQLVRLKTISSDTSTAAREQSWKGAQFLLGLLEDLGAETRLVTASDDSNPVVLARITTDPSKLTVTICGHYDVPAADTSPESWRADPFDVTAMDGYLYGRGVSDGKGPLIATMFAVKDLVCSGELSINLNFVIDGMQDSNSQGFQEVIQNNLEWFEGTGLLLTSTGAWICDEHPCLIYGMRGLIRLLLEISGPSKDLHSGTHGGTFNEPMNDLVTVLSTLVDSHGFILVPGFYDDVRPPSGEEDALYTGLGFDLEEYKRTSGLSSLSSSSPRDLLQNRWRHPSLSLVGIDSAPGTWSLIPKTCAARVCVRHVPSQDANRLVERFRDHVAHEFAKLRSSGNKLNVTVQRVGDWWLADPSSSFYQLAEKAIRKHWGVAPKYVREGSTMHVVPYLESVLGAPAVLIPLSQATDHAALQNERLRWTNFVKGKDVIREFLKSLGEEQ